MVMLRTANPPPSVRFRPRPPFLLGALALLISINLEARAGAYALDDIPQDLGTPLLNAVEREDDAAIDNLIAQKQNVNQPGLFGITPLMRAAYKSNYGLTKKLLLNGANVNSQDEGGATPLHYAVRTQDSSIIVLLVENGANVNAADKNGITPTQLANRLRDDRIKQILHPPSPVYAFPNKTLKPVEAQDYQPHHHESLNENKMPKREVGYIEQTKPKTKSKPNLMVGEAQIVDEPLEKIEHNKHSSDEEEEYFESQNAYQIRIDGFSEIDHVLAFWDELKTETNFASKQVVVTLGEDDRGHAMLVGIYHSLLKTHEDCLTVHQKDYRLGCTIICHRDTHHYTSTIPGSRH